MRIAHLMLSCFYIDDFGYQENLLPRQHAADGHDVLILASTVSFVDAQRLGYVAARAYTNGDGIPVVRLPYQSWLPRELMRRVRAYRGVTEALEHFQPDVILFHGVTAWALRTVATYCRKHPSTRLFVDSHEDRINSARDWASRWLLHRLYYRWVLRSSLSAIERVLHVTIESKRFLQEMYGVPEDKFEFYPLGGVIETDEVRLALRARVRRTLELPHDAILMLHAGKMDPLKRTAEVVAAFSAVADSRFRLLLVGSMPPDLERALRPSFEADKRIRFLGWKSPDELRHLLHATDLYVQPGSQSATMQAALCAGVAVMLCPQESHDPYLKGNGYFVRSIEEMISAFQEIQQRPELLREMGLRSLAIARAMLDYRSLAARIYRTD